MRKQIALSILRKYENRPIGYNEDEIVNAMIEFSNSEKQSDIIAKKQKKHREYLNALEVVENPCKYDHRDLERAIKEVEDYKIEGNE